MNCVHLTKFVVLRGLALQKKTAVEVAVQLIIFTTIGAPNILQIPIILFIFCIIEVKALSPML